MDGPLGVKKGIELNTTEREQRIAALDTRLRIEGFALELLDFAAPYLNDEDKIGWKPADIIRFLVAEIDPKFLSGRRIEISPQVPDADNPTDEEYEKLDWYPFGFEPDIKIQRLKKFWNSMGQLLHQNAKLRAFDIGKAKRQIREANDFCDTLSPNTLFAQSSIRPVERKCVMGHSTKRNAARLKVDQVIPCMEPTCQSAFIVQGTEPLVWSEIQLPIKCDACNKTHFYPLWPLTGLSYWEKATVLCLNEDCGSQIEVRWVLSRRTS